MILEKDIETGDWEGRNQELTSIQSDRSFVTSWGLLDRRNAGSMHFHIGFTFYTQRFSPGSIKLGSSPTRLLAALYEVTGFRRILSDHFKGFSSTRTHLYADGNTCSRALLSKAFYEVKNTVVKELPSGFPSSQQKQLCQQFLGSLHC